MISISFTHNGTTYHRITKDIARKAYNAGKTVLLAPCKMNPTSPWIDAYKCYINSSREMPDFDSFINSFEYYSCNNHTGRYAAFYIANA